MKVCAVHGIPTAPSLFTTLPWPDGWTIDAPALPTVEEGGPGPFDLRRAIEALRPRAEAADLLIGHDMGGLIACALRREDQGLVLAGTSVSRRYWELMRITAWPVLHRYFYRAHGGRTFLRFGTEAAARVEAFRRYGDHGSHWPERMRRVARGLVVPPGLEERVRMGPTLLLWGRDDPWYPLHQARALAERTGARLTVLDGRHLLPLERPSAWVGAVEDFANLWVGGRRPDAATLPSGSGTLG